MTAPLVDGATEYETAQGILRQHVTGLCPQCGGGCMMVDWARRVVDEHDQDGGER